MRKITSLLIAPLLLILSLNVAAQLKHKIDVMNAHRRDYDRLFTSPNP